MDKKGKYKSPWQATLNGITDLYRKKEATVELPDNIDLTGKTVLITGSSAGLGFAAAKRIAKAGAKVIMAVRSGIPEKGEEVIRYSGNPNVKMLHIDLLDFESINQFLANLEKESTKIDILISNAAMVPLKSRKTHQGLEEMFMVNYLAPFYLINQLINRNVLLPEKSKIIIVASESHRNPKEFEWDKFGKYEAYGIKETVSRYGYYKLLLTTFANELSRRLSIEKKQIAIRVLCPGPVNSNIAREAPKLMQPLLKLVFSIFFRSPEKASDPIMYFASETNHDGRPIDYLFLMQQKEMDEKALDEVNGKKLWELSQGLIDSVLSEKKVQNK
jgi:NAD(P)-dependent dehydrogenase (short-subunit alcohol dehydrogenase family)